MKNRLLKYTLYIFLVIVAACNYHPNQAQKKTGTDSEFSIAFQNQFDALIDTSIGIADGYSLYHTEYDSKVTITDILKSGANYYLIDFWASWNMKCRNFNTNFKWQYDTLRSCGVEIIGIGTHDTLNSFIRAVEDDRTPWVQLYDMDNFLAEELNLKGVPVKVLVDKNGKIIRVFKDGFSLSEFINKPEYL